MLEVLDLGSALSPRPRNRADSAPFLIHLLSCDRRKHHVDQLVFTHSADTWQERWEIIRRFATVWCGIRFAPSPMAETRLSEAEKIIGRSLPGSLRESIRFHSELEAAGWSYGLAIKPMPDLQAVLLWSIEDDWYSVVHEGDFTLDDPPVHGYLRGDSMPTED